MQSSEMSTDVVHPEVRAHIMSLVSALGGVDEEGQYQLGDDALDVLRDMKKWIRFYDQKLNRMDVARCLAETNLVGNDLLRILAMWPENVPAHQQRFRSRLALACFEVLTPLTWPLETDAETATVNHYRHLPALRLAQLAYKRAIINFDGTPILHTAVRVALPAMAVPLADRSVRDQGIIKLVLFFLRNVAMIEPSTAGSSTQDSDEAQMISRSATLDAFSFQDILMLLLTMASNMGDDFRTEDVLVLEIIFHLVKRVDIHKLFMEDAERNTVDGHELAALMQQEASMLQSFRHGGGGGPGPTRHSRFGTMVWLSRGDGRMSTLTGQEALTSSAARQLKLESAKKGRPRRRIARRRKPGEELLELMVGTGASPVVLNARATAQLRGFVEELLDAGFNPLFQHVRRSIDREAPHVLRYHRSQFLYLVAWFLEAERVRHSRKPAGPAPATPATTATPADINSFNLVAGVLNQEMFIFLNRALDQAQNDKDRHELTVVMRCFTQILLTVQAMSESRNEEDRDIAENILSRLFYEESTHDAIAKILRNYKDQQGLDFLDACTELAHTYIRLLEAYSKQNVDLQVRSRRRKRSKRKAAARQTAGDAENEGGGGGGGGAAPDAPEEGDDEADDEAAAQKTSVERKFDFRRFAIRFAAKAVVDTFVKFTALYNDLSDAQLKRAHRYFYRVAFKQEMLVMLLRVDVIRLLYNMIKGPQPLQRDHRSTIYRDWKELVRHILRKGFPKLDGQPVVLAEMIFSENASDENFLEYGFAKQTIYPVAAAKPAAEIVFRDETLSRDRQIAIAVGILLEKNLHHHLAWVKQQLSGAEAERRSWQALHVAVDTERAAAAAAAAVEEPQGEGHDNANGVDTAHAETPLPDNTASPITIQPEDGDGRKAMFKNGPLRLLMKLVGFERLTPLVEESVDSVWVVPARLTADEMQESLDLIKQAEFDPPVFDNDQSAEDQVRRKMAPRKKAVYDDDNDADNAVDDEMFFEMGGPTARKVADDGRPKKTGRRRRRRGDGEDEVPELEPTEEELDERARKRRQKELEKARRIKSDLYVHASDDETDDERDKEFFEREEATRKRVHRSIMESTAAVVAAAEEEEAAAVAAAGKKTKKTKKTGASSKRKLSVVSDHDDDDDDDDDDDNDDDDDDENSKDDDSSSQSSRRRKRRRSVGEAEETAERAVRPRVRQHAGFVDSSDDEDEEDKGDGDQNGKEDRKDKDETVDGEAMDMDKMKISSPHAEADEDEDEVVPAAGKRQRARAGFLLDSDDED